MTTITIEKTSNITKNKFSDFNQLVSFLIDEGLTNYTTVGIMDKNNMSNMAKEMYKNSKKCGNGNLIDITKD